MSRKASRPPSRSRPDSRGLTQQAPKKKRRPSSKEVGLVAAPPVVTVPTATMVDRAGELRDMFRMFLAQRSELTVRNYLIDLQHFTRWMSMQAGSLTWEEVRAMPVPRPAIEATLLGLFSLKEVGACAIVAQYLDDMRTGKLDRKYAVQTINHRLAALKSLARLARTLEISDVALDEIKGFKASASRSTEGCGEEAVMQMFECAEARLRRAKGKDEKYRASRDLVLLSVMYHGGLRRFELMGVRWPDDVDFTGLRLRFRGKKRDAPEWHPFTARVLDEIRRFLKYRGEYEGALISGRTPGVPLEVSMVNRIIEDLAAEAHVNVTPHGLRHTAATVLLEKTNGNVRAVAQFLRHASTRHVQIYDDDRQKLAAQMGDLLAANRKTSAS